MILAIDPGTEQSACVIYDSTPRVPQPIRFHAILPNDEMLKLIREKSKDTQWDRVLYLVIEQVACYGMAVGESVFETVFWSGRFAEAWNGTFHRLTRHAIKMHLCHSARAKDANIRQALVDKLGSPGKKSAPGKTHGISSHKWAALALAVAFAETIKCGERLRK